MKNLLTILFLVTFIIHSSFFHSKADTLINSLNIEIIQGKVPTYYATGNNKAATYFSYAFLKVMTKTH
jgi:hypothetical protein